MLIHGEIPNISYIIVTGFKHSVLSNVVDFNEQGMLVSQTSRWHNKHGLVIVNLITAGEPRLLILKSLLSNCIMHLSQNSS